MQVRERGWVTCGSANPSPHIQVFVIFLKGGHPPWFFLEKKTLLYLDFGDPLTAKSQGKGFYGQNSFSTIFVSKHLNTTITTLINYHGPLMYT